VHDVSYKYVKFSPSSAVALWEDGENRRIEVEAPREGEAELPPVFTVKELWRDSGFSSEIRHVVSPSKAALRQAAVKDVNHGSTPDVARISAAGDATSVITVGTASIPEEIASTLSDRVGHESAGVPPEAALHSKSEPAEHVTSPGSSEDSHLSVDITALHHKESAFQLVEHHTEGNGSTRSRASTDDSFTNNDVSTSRRPLRCNSCLNCHGMSDAVPNCNCCPRGCGKRFRESRGNQSKGSGGSVPIAASPDASPAIVVDIDHVHPKVVVVSHDEPTVASAPLAAVTNRPSSPVKLTNDLAVERAVVKPPPSSTPGGATRGSKAPAISNPEPAKKKSGCCVIA
jgi:hypothetical protein